MNVSPEIQACRRLAYAIIRIVGNDAGNAIVRGINHRFDVAVMRLVPPSSASELWELLKNEALAAGISLYEIDAQKHESRSSALKNSKDEPSRIDLLCWEIAFLRARWRLRMDEDAPEFPLKQPIQQ